MYTNNSPFRGLSTAVSQRKIPALFMIAIATAITVSSCGSTTNNSKQVEEQTATTATKEQGTATLVGINGEGIPIREAPGENSKKVINKKATEALGETQYCEVDYSVKVAVLETKDKWTKIKVMVPEWVSDSHIGWIPSKYLISGDEEEKLELKSLSSNEYEIMKTDNSHPIPIFYVLLKRTSFDKHYVYQFVKQFRKEHCTTKCNVYVYDTKSILPLIGIYPLKPNDYIKMADHLISMSTFDAAEVRDWYPFQDFKYKEYGGKNWKKEPIK